jgi:acyl-CoA dehydrogenase
MAGLRRITLLSPCARTALRAAAQVPTRPIPARSLATGTSDYNPFAGLGGPDESFYNESERSVREAIQGITSQFPDQFWADCEKEERYPHELHKELCGAGFLGIAVPEEYGGSGLGIAEAAVMLQTIAESGGGIAGAQSIHANVYPLQPVVKFASPEQKKRWLPPLLEGRDRRCAKSSVSSFLI